MLKAGFFTQLSGKAGIVSAVDQVSFVMEEGEIVGLVGESGCGKTSLLRVIAGVESYDFGSVLFDGVDGSELDQRDKDISYVSQNYALFPHKTVYENIAMPLFTNKYPRNEIRKRVSELAEQFGLQMLLTRLRRPVGRTTTACCHCARPCKTSVDLLV